MVGTTLAELRDRIETLASPDGEYYLVCARTGDRPVPAAEARFGSRSTAQRAARATEQYRRALRRYDPRLPHYDVVVCQAVEPHVAGERRAGDSTEDVPADTDSEDAPAEPTRRRRIDLCHSVAAAVFETLSAAGHDAVESAVMDTYFDLAETVDDLDDLCVCLLESMATELDRRLSPDERADVLADAAGRLPPVDPARRPIPAAFSHLRDRGLLDGYVESPPSVDADGGTRSVVVRLSGYVLSPRNGRLPVLPLVLALYRGADDWPPTALRAARVDGDWRLTLVFARDGGPEGLASVPIRPAL
ncbi:DUF7551 domain-containing protein [Haloarcula nitratireducens]|uniref:Uncharacterized protein n=1 Tax=Haloarcula nitratireducens TaxID=2487749 RepID=A0AAW4PGN6_9EURY|nr:hypothetical protein [Halomicroarcula nitratireducens]MBX0297144.1 hypothetical protein [Halomicroarcula nitratireducens]